MGGRTHACLVGEQAPGHAVAHGLPHADTHGAAQDGLGVEGTLKNQGKGVRQVGNIGNQHDEAAHQIEAGHDRHQLLRDGGNAGDAAQEDEGGHHRQHHAHDPGGDAQRLLEGVADGVGLDHVAGEAQGEDDSQREEAR